MLQSVSLCDEIVFQVRNDDRIVLTCDDPEIPVDETNLIVKAARALSDQHGANIQLSKKIPVKGGLGGGSSNAAVTLLALNRLWRLDRRDRDLRQIGAQLGADVPFFFAGGTCVARGVGTQLEEVADFPKQYLIILTPNASVSTANAYAALNAPPLTSLNAPSLTSTESLSILSSSFTEPFFGDSSQWPLHNDFEGVIFEREPEIGRAKKALLAAGARNALLAGSGSSVFGIFSDRAARDQALDNLESKTGWRVFACHTLSRSEYLQSINRQSDTGA